MRLEGFSEKLHIGLVCSLVVWLIVSRFEIDRSHVFGLVDACTNCGAGSPGGRIVFEYAVPLSEDRKFGMTSMQASCRAFN